MNADQHTGVEKYLRLHHRYTDPITRNIFGNFWFFQLGEFATQDKYFFFFLLPNS